MASTITAKDVAQSASVSIATVSRVFNNRGNVTPEVRQRVLKIASELGYFSSTTGSLQQTGNSRAITVKECGFLIYDPNMDDRAATANNFWLHILHGVENEASKFNVKVVYRGIGSLIQDPHLLLNQIYEMRLSGILLVGPVKAEIVQQLQTTNLPLVLVDNYIPKLPVDGVLCNNLEGSRQVMEYLMQAGHERIAFLGGPSGSLAWPSSKIYSIEQRLLGYQIALLEAGKNFDPQLIVASALTREGGYEACQQLLTKRLNFSAIFCANDMVALGALKALKEAGIQVPTDISLVGFDDVEAAEYVDPALTTVRVFKEALGASALRRLLTRATDPNALNELNIVNVEVVKRGSVASPRSK
jgi:LacI family transcriptional regulator